MPAAVAFQLDLFTQPLQPAGLAPRVVRDVGCAAPRRPDRPLSVCVLGSGSGGNSTVMRFGRHAVLIDAGFGPRTTARRLTQAGLTLDDVSAVCLTHFDTDHFRKTWVRTLVDRGISLFCHHWHLPDLRRVQNNQQLFDAGLVEVFGEEPFAVAAGLTASTVRLQHDRQGTIGYRFDTDHGCALGYATDLGHAPEHLCVHFAGVDILCIESNYDEHMTIHSSRPAWVNRRNLSDSGHLSNEQSLAAVQRIAELSPQGNPRQVVLLHRSDQCNHPMKVRRCFEADPPIARRVSLTDQRRRTRWFKVSPMKAVRRCQMPLAASLALTVAEARRLAI